MTSWLRQDSDKQIEMVEDFEDFFKGKVSVPKTFLKLKLRLYSLCFHQNTLMLTESLVEFRDLHSIFRLRALRYCGSQKTFFLFFSMPLVWWYIFNIHPRREWKTHNLLTVNHVVRFDIAFKNKIYRLVVFTVSVLVFHATSQEL